MLLLPRMLLHRPPRGGLIAKDKLHISSNHLPEASGWCCWRPAVVATKKLQLHGEGVVIKAMMCRRGRLEQS